jgi:hypothetical protein
MARFGRRPRVSSYAAHKRKKATSSCLQNRQSLVAFQLLRDGVQLRALAFKGSDKVSNESLSQAFRKSNFKHEKTQETRGLLRSFLYIVSKSSPALPRESPSYPDDVPS